MRKIIFWIVVMSIAAACKGNQELSNTHSHIAGPAPTHANQHMNQSNFEALVARFESASRNEWQQPDAVLGMMGSLKGKTVYDLGAGTGLFSVLFLQEGAKVISSDSDPRFTAFMSGRRTGLSVSPYDWEIRLVPESDPRLESNEADWIFVCNVYHHIDNREQYFNLLREGLKDEGTLLIIDFKGGDLPVGPSDEIKLPAEQVAKELEQAGFSGIEIDQTSLPYQYAVSARK